MELSTRQEPGRPHGHAACKEGFEEQEGEGPRGTPLCTEQFVQNGNLVDEIGAKNNVSVLHAVFIEDESGKILEKERDSDAAKGEERDGNYYIDQEPEPLASLSSALDSHQLRIATTCSYLPTYFIDLNADPPIPETELNQELTNHAKSQDQAGLYCLNVTEKVIMKKQKNPIFVAGSPKTSAAALGDIRIPEQIQDVNQKLSLGHATRISARCAVVNCSSQQSYRLSSFEVSKVHPDGTREKECPPEMPEEPAPPAQKKKRTFYSAVCKEEFEEQEGNKLLCTEQFVQNGNLVDEIGAKNNVSVLHAVFIEDESGKILEKERDSDAAKGEERDGNYYIDQEPEPLASRSSALDSHQLRIATTCSYLPTYFSDLNTDPPIPETERSQELTNHAKSQDQAELYCLNVMEKVTMKNQNNPVFAAGSPKTSAALGDIHIPEQIQDVNQKLSLGHATRISARCAVVNCSSQQSYRLSSFEVSKVHPDGTREKECPPETPEEPAPPAQKKKRTFYSAEQLDELERMFQEDHYPGNEKRREIAAALGVTPQRIMVWFQNRRAKWRKIEKLTAKGNQKCSTTVSALSVDPQQSSQGATLLPVPQLPDSVHYRPAALMMGTATISCSSMLNGQAALLASTSVTSVTGRTSYESFQTKSISQGTFGSLKEERFPAITSPPPIRRASLPLNMVFNPNNHIVPLMLDTPSSEYSPASQENSSSEAFTYSIQSQSINVPGHCSYPEQLEPTANLETPYYHPGSQSGAYQYPQHQMSQFHHFPIHLTGNVLPSVHLTPATPSKSSTSFFSLPGNDGLVTYGTAEGPPGYLQNHIRGQRLIQPSAGSSGYIPAFQAVPWNERYIQGAPFASRLCSEMPSSSSGGGCYSAEQTQYTQNQSVPPSSCLLQVPKATVPGCTMLFSAKQMAPADPNSNTDHQSQAGHRTPLEEDSDIDNILKDEERVADFSEERKN